MAWGELQRYTFYVHWPIRSPGQRVLWNFKEIVFAIHALSTTTIAVMVVTEVSHPSQFRPNVVSFLPSKMPFYGSVITQWRCTLVETPTGSSISDRQMILSRKNEIILVIRCVTYIRKLIKWYEHYFVREKKKNLLHIQHRCWWHETRIHMKLEWKSCY